MFNQQEYQTSMSESINVNVLTLYNVTQIHNLTKNYITQILKCYYIY